MADKIVSRIPHFPPLPKVKRVAVYCRVSSRIEEQIRSVGTQASYLVDMVVRHGGCSFQGIYILIFARARLQKTARNFSMCCPRPDRS